MKNSFWMASVVLSAFVYPSMATAADLFSEIYVFGDSLSDTGNAFAGTGGQIPPSPPYFDGHFSNGPIWVEFLATDLGLTPNQNTNFAIGGAVTGLEAIFVIDDPPVQVPVPGVLGQVNTFLGGLQAAGQNADPDALYTIWAGANDYLFNNFTDPSTPVSNLSTAIEALAGVGAQNILVANLPSLGLLPLTNGDPVVSAGLNALTQAHNASLLDTVNALDQTLAPEVELTLLDINSIFTQAIANPAQFGFTNVTESCLASVVPLVVCNNPNEYLVWDAIHPTSATQQIIGKAAFNAVHEPANVPEPGVSILGALAVGALGKAFERRQKTRQIARSKS
ncbi:SGNH/GDSL hydrolase family protein [Oscillatoriales cyanobacterium LEGE 11467]|uniref:SGNH/GDSL hydrolase family protein n=2 Tax=Zarconia TaxID=2992130 RepID=A0A928VWF1_9CYAN|nr:SGNH/GDSL hydrolase family protein [Zarconia navalis LEGE 11467]